jgi:hypothetical protein
MSFPLYEVVRSQANLKPVKTKERKQICASILQLPIEAKELVYLLIREHAKRENKKEETLPYKAKQMIDGIHFSPEELPGNIWGLLRQFLLINHQAEQEQRPMDDES